jgi:hypothetical protein
VTERKQRDRRLQGGSTLQAGMLSLQHAAGWKPRPRIKAGGQGAGRTAAGHAEKRSGTEDWAALAEPRARVTVTQ